MPIEAMCCKNNALKFNIVSVFAKKNPTEGRIFACIFKVCNLLVYLCLY